MMADPFPGFESRRVRAEGGKLFCRVGGDGPPVALLHGYPQTHASWHRVAPELARHFRCVVFDLPGYGESYVPDPAADHRPASKRAMARDIASAMAALGHERFSLLGHDRGARVAYRLALDMPQRVDRIGIVEVVPTSDMWANFDAEMGMKAYHWTFLAQPYPLPERMIGADPVAYLEWTLASWSLDGTLASFDPLALEDYRRSVSDPARVRAFCEDYRAGATIDHALDIENLKADCKIAAPLFFLWSHHGFPARTGVPLGIWQKWASDVSGASAQAGHFVQEENPQAVLQAYIPFFQGRA